MSEEAKQEIRSEGQVAKSGPNPKVMRMGTAPIGKLMFEFGVPAVAAVVFNALYNIIDSVFLGQAMGEVGLAATTVAAPVMTVLIAISVIAGAGGNALAAIMLGEGKRDLAEKTLGNAMTLVLLEAVPIALVALFCLDPILRVVGATDTTLPYARLFMQIIAFGFVFNNISFGINNFIRTAGAPYLALATAGVGTVACIALNYLFVLVFGWGVAGSASATVLGQVVSSVWVLWYFIFDKKAPFKLRARNLAPDWKLCGRIVTMGMAPFALQAAAAITQVIANSTLAYLGSMDVLGTDGALASIGVVMKIVMFAVFPAIGVSIAAQPILGFNIGARKFDRVKRALYDAIVVATVILVFFFAIIHLFPVQLVSLFGVDQHLMDFSIVALQIQTFFIPIIGVQIIGSNYFQATGQPVKSTILSLTRQLIFVLPMYFLAPMIVPHLVPGVTPLLGFCFAFPVADVLSVVLCSIFLVREIRRLDVLTAEQKRMGEPNERTDVRESR